MGYLGMGRISVANLVAAIGSQIVLLSSEYYTYAGLNYLKSKESALTFNPMHNLQQKPCAQ